MLVLIRRGRPVVGSLYWSTERRVILVKALVNLDSPCSDQNILTSCARPSFPRTVYFIYPDVGGSSILSNVGTFLEDYTSSLP